jgi:hypothetical protein
MKGTAVDACHDGQQRQQPPAGFGSLIQLHSIAERSVH